jgi:hypothetical protein
LHLPQIAQDEGYGVTKANKAARRCVMRVADDYCPDV